MHRPSLKVVELVDEVRRAEGFEAEPDPTLGEALLALLELIWRIVTLGPRLVGMTAFALAETLRP